jgi:hypothetical protein
LVKCDRVSDDSETDSDEDYYSDEYDYGVENNIESVEAMREYDHKFFFRPHISNNINFKYYDR